MYTTLTLICLQHCLHYAPYNGAATHGSPQDNLIMLKCSQFINVPTFKRTLLTSSQSSLNFSTIFAIGHLFRIKSPS